MTLTVAISVNLSAGWLSANSISPLRGAIVAIYYWSQALDSHSSWLTLPYRCSENPGIDKFLSSVRHSIPWQT